MQFSGLCVSDDLIHSKMESCARGDWGWRFEKPRNIRAGKVIAPSQIAAQVVPLSNMTVWVISLNSKRWPLPLKPMQNCLKLQFQVCLLGAGSEKTLFVYSEVNRKTPKKYKVKTLGSQKLFLPLLMFVVDLLTGWKTNKQWVERH